MSLLLLLLLLEKVKEGRERVWGGRKEVRGRSREAEGGRGEMVRRCVRAREGGKKVGESWRGRLQAWLLLLLLLSLLLLLEQVRAEMGKALPVWLPAVMRTGMESSPTTFRPALAGTHEIWPTVSSVSGEKKTPSCFSAWPGTLMSVWTVLTKRTQCARSVA